MILFLWRIFQTVVQNLIHSYQLPVFNINVINRTPLGEVPRTKIIIVTHWLIYWYAGNIKVNVWWLVLCEWCES